jgi:hypothetical protein
MKGQIDWPIAAVFLAQLFLPHSVVGGRVPFRQQAAPFVA